MNILRFGVLGAARITPAALIKPARNIDEIQITRIAARNRDRAEAFANEYGIPNVSGSYDDLLASTDIDIIYNPLPMSLHAEWTIAALRAGKHVLCEKPLAANAREAAEMVLVAAVEGRILGEAFHYRYHPYFQRVLDEVRSGRIGTVTHIDANFAVTVRQPDLRWDYATAGGSTMDLGCYPVSWVRQVMGEEPLVSSARAVVGPPNIDAELEADLVFPSGATARVFSSMQSDERKINMTIIGTEGSIVADNPLAPQNGNLLTITTAGGVASESINTGVSYEYMLRAFVDHIQHGGPYPTQGADSIANMATIDAMYDAAGLPHRGLE
ncbi:MAG: Gfo/Idh/MocA family oxidoreductase [Acidimicrobiia bacterium]|nr:Gfo/Idh/MocA family oxidoreductase [Acidimicrobiia bacterium]